MKNKRKTKLSHRLFSSYLDEGERIVDIAHSHILVFKVAAGKASFFGIILPLFLWYLFPTVPPLFPIAWICVGLVSLVYHFVDWYFDAWLLTNMGVIDVERNGFFDVSATRIEYHMMEGISYQINGILRTIFGYGDITIDKLGTKTSVILRDAANPKKLERRVLKLQDQYIRTRSVRDHGALKDMLSEMIAFHANKKNIDYTD